MQFEQVTGAMRAEFDTTLKVKLDTLRQELRREKDLAIQELKAGLVRHFNERPRGANTPVRFDLPGNRI